MTLSGSHVFPGEIVAMSSLGSALAVAMMVAGRGDPTPRRVAQYRLDACTGVGACSSGSVLHLLPRSARPAFVSRLTARRQVACVP